MSGSSPVRKKAKADQLPTATRSNRLVALTVDTDVWVDELPGGPKCIHAVIHKVTRTQPAQYVLRYGTSTAESPWLLAEQYSRHRLGLEEEKDPAGSGLRVGTMTYNSMFSAEMKAEYFKTAKAEEAKTRRAQAAVKAVAKVEWSMSLRDCPKTGMLTCTITPLGSKPEFVPELKTDVSKLQGFASYPWKIPTMSQEGVLLTKQEKGQLKDDVAIWVVMGWAGHPVAIHVPEGLTDEQVNAIRVAFDFDGSVKIWQYGCGASGCHTRATCRVLMDLEEAKVGFFGSKAADFEILFIEFTAGNESARAWYVRTKGQSQVLKSFQLGGCISRQMKNKMEVEERRAAAPVRQLFDALVSGFLPEDHQHKALAGRAW